jgi:ABC-type branched-subunit amino acid transport system substrate-binding protein
MIALALAFGLSFPLASAQESPGPAPAAARVVAPGRVGTLLPRSGRYASVGAQIREALDVGWTEGGGPGTLVHADSGGTAESAVVALRRLVEVEHVGAVLGPLLSDEAEAVAAEAERLGVPLVVLSQGAEDATRWTWVLQGWLTPSQQIGALLDETFGARGWSRYAVLAPANDYGRRATELFRTAVAARGGEVVVDLTYPPDATTLSEPAKALAPRPAPNAPPVIAYDAVFIPDRARQIPLVAAALAVEDVPLGGYKPYEDGPVRLLGLSPWNAWDLVAAGGTYVLGALFTDVFVPPPDAGYTWQPAEGWSSFVALYRQATGRAPTPAEALAVEASAIVAVAARSRPETREAFREALLAARRDAPVTGATHFDPVQRRLQRRVRVISVSRSGLAPVER